MCPEGIAGGGAVVWLLYTYCRIKDKLCKHLPVYARQWAKIAVTGRIQSEILLSQTIASFLLRSQSNMGHRQCLFLRPLPIFLNVPYRIFCLLSNNNRRIQWVATP